jgi:ubiquinone/menaquinone biosynthesis C-methylase UbiE
MPDSKQDIWIQWLLNRRFGGDPQRMKMVMDRLYSLRDRLLSHIDLGHDETLLDVGCGDGLIAFGALDRFEACQVIFSDISDDLLNHAERLANEMNVHNRCQFLHASADDLSMLNDESVDAVTTRSVLIYVSAKQQAFNEFQRVLKPGGQLSIFEPINRFAFPEPPGRFAGYDVSPIMEIAEKVEALYQRIQPTATDPMTDFDERDLIRQVEKAGFREIHLELRAVISPSENADWSVLLHTAGNPKIPTLEEAIQQALTPEEAEKFVKHLRPLVESKQGVDRSAVAYLWAVK